MKQLWSHMILQNSLLPPLLTLVHFPQHTRFLLRLDFLTGELPQGLCTSHSLYWEGLLSSTHSAMRSPFKCHLLIQTWLNTQHNTWHILSLKLLPFCSYNLSPSHDHLIFMYVSTLLLSLNYGDFSFQHSTLLLEFPKHGECSTYSPNAWNIFLLEL